ncbi:hypothetical protein L596_000333 [Steinernema carpocapsae]|uniref:Uncharacterized protein n=1 Tax=Steinernema carpocapsae TaxID=34508 RepID=A0A4V6I727_STECR|nr:hypothetical protein L596_000333 [Steinernema carpocapsae]
MYKRATYITLIRGEQRPEVSSTTDRCCNISFPSPIVYLKPISKLPQSRPQQEEWRCGSELLDRAGQDAVNLVLYHLSQTPGRDSGLAQLLGRWETQRHWATQAASGLLERNPGEEHSREVRAVSDFSKLPDAIEEKVLQPVHHLGDAIRMRSLGHNEGSTKEARRRPAPDEKKDGMRATRRPPFQRLVPTR